MSLCFVFHLSVLPSSLPAPVSWLSLWFQKQTSPKRSYGLTLEVIYSVCIFYSRGCASSLKYSFMSISNISLTKHCFHSLYPTVKRVFNLQYFISCQMCDVTVKTDSYNTITLLSIHIQFGMYTTLTVQWNSIIMAALCLHAIVSVCSTVPFNQWLILFFFCMFYNLVILNSLYVSLCTYVHFSACCVYDELVTWWQLWCSVGPSIYHFSSSVEDVGISDPSGHSWKSAEIRHDTITLFRNMPKNTRKK